MSVHDLFWQTQLSSQGPDLIFVEVLQWLDDFPLKEEEQKRLKPDRI